jgi:AcrR family transcriptional regulator
MAERGFTGTTIADISEAADLGFGTFYLYFKSKEDVLTTVLDEGFSSMLKRVQDPCADRLSVWEALRFVTEQFVGAARENTDLFVILFHHGPDLLRSARRFGDAFTQRLQAVLERGIWEGAVRPVPTALVARALTGLYVQALLWRGEDGLCPADEIMEALFPIVHHGLAVQRGGEGGTA